MEETKYEGEETHWIRRSERKGIRMGQLTQRLLENIQKSDTTQNPRKLLLEFPRAQKSVISLRNFASSILIEPPYTERYVRWCERSGVNHSLLLDYICMSSMINIITLIHTNVHNGTQLLNVYRNAQENMIVIVREFNVE